MKAISLVVPVVAAAVAAIVGSIALGRGQPQTKPAEAAKAQPADGAKDPSAADPAYVLGYTMDDIDGKPVNLEQYKGKVLLIVNVASRCGYTSQYEGLQKMYTERHDKGFEILGFPANDFMSQEPGTNTEIKSFCTTKYNVTFPMFSKISVKGEKQHPLYKQLASQPKPVGEEPGWNFTKYLVDRSGRVVARYAPGIKPDDKELQAKVDELMAAK